MLDTSAVIDLPAAGLNESDEYLVSSITVAELNAGVHKTPDPIERAIRVDRLLWLAEALDVLPFTESAARMYGQLTALMLAAGRNPRPRRLDLLIASVAATHQVPLVTRNAKDFTGLAPLLEVVDLNG
ncbi:type II toxin-antitoxin system VapC family toxin [Pseudonocardia acaciae]|uniref:type II toxin-antitoxin system VapC family toxin n=1 Tax=Pseudonocardia acaciae TaxID=551276 RepID=UPI001FE2009E|nr:type II toxin-antitoxin system VapC family toxin [Pseudonocardia acaciae]